MVMLIKPEVSKMTYFSWWSTFSSSLQAIIIIIIILNQEQYSYGVTGFRYWNAGFGAGGSGNWSLYITVWSEAASA